MYFEDFIFHMIGNNRKTAVLELDDYFNNKYTNIYKCKEMSVTKQNFSKRRSY
jgi:hypothetical protein